MSRRNSLIQSSSNLKYSYLREILANSYARNKENLQRIDKLTGIVARQNDKIQERADRVLALLEKNNNL